MCKHKAFPPTRFLNRQSQSHQVVPVIFKRTTLITYLATILLASFSAVVRADQQPTQQQLEFFEKKVRPLLVKHCYECHSVNSKRIEGEFLLDSRASLLKGGESGVAIVLGDVAGSPLIEAIRYETYEMPPKGKLPASDIATLERWVGMGAPWPDEAAPVADNARDEFDLERRKSEFWVWQPVRSDTPPAVTNSAWPRSDLDRYIQARLEEADLSPAGDADRTVLMRRLYFDLIGLPPTVEQVKGFEANTSEDAVEQLVDELLDSAHFGERWGRHWLDLVRYAESRGHEFDNDTPNAFQYRDYVIRALNADVPYDEFVREHIAGDLLPKPRLHPTQKFNESVLGTGFWFLGEWVHSPVDIRKDESDRFDNMLDVMSKTFLGVTVACARCHDHKFDAISTADYYSLSGFLQSSDYHQVRFESIEQNRRIAQQLAQLDAKYQGQIADLLDAQGVRLPSQTSYLTDEAIVVDYGNLPQTQYLQDGFIFGPSPQREGLAYFDSAESGSVMIATHAAAASDPLWNGLESITEGRVHDRNSLAKIPMSGRTLRTPTFELKHGTVSCLVKGEGHVVACVDSHRLVAGPLHKQTIKPLKTAGGWVELQLNRYLGHRLHLEFTPAAKSQLSVRMVTQGLDANGRADIDRRLAANDKQYHEYGKAAEAILNGGEQSDSVEKVEETIFADFESGTYDGWAVTGKAFGRIPQTLTTIAGYQGKINGRGKYFVNSHNIRDGGDVVRGDRLTGTLTSPSFKIDFDAIEFLVGGGDHKAKTCVNLVIDGKAVLSATGRRNNQMSINTWNVRPFVGKEAQIQVVDDHTSGWGNIGIDHIVFRRGGINSASTSSHQIVQAWQRERAQLASQIVRKSRLAMAMRDGTGEDDRVLIRGNSSKPGEVEPRHFLTAISGDSPMPIRKGSGRLELADHINDPGNPLTSRVIVNRIWHHLMGRGIVSTTDDFGYLGQRPSHPKLLDHLADWFIKDGRSIKRMIRYIVLSRTYQMSSRSDSKAVAADPKNTLWHHRPPKRLEGEVIRDSLLAISGRLDRTQFGEPVPIHLTNFMDGRGRPAKSGPLDGNGRRSIYIAVRRNFLSPFMLTFDTPVPFSAMGRRNSSNVPAQSLILMNDPLVVEQSWKWAERALAVSVAGSASGVVPRIEWMYRSAFARLPTERERQAASFYVKSQSASRGVAIADAGVWSDIAHALMNTKEFIFVP